MALATSLAPWVCGWALGLCRNRSESSPSKYLAAFLMSAKPTRDFVRNIDHLIESRDGVAEVSRVRQQFFALL
jgi:hypothetical protein